MQITTIIKVHATKLFYIYMQLKCAVQLLLTIHACNEQLDEHNYLVIMHAQIRIKPHVAHITIHNKANGWVSEMEFRTIVTTYIIQLFRTQLHHQTDVKALEHALQLLNKQTNEQYKMMDIHVTINQPSLQMIGVIACTCCANIEEAT